MKRAAIYYQASGDPMSLANVQDRNDQIEATYNYCHDHGLAVAAMYGDLSCPPDALPRERSELSQLLRDSEIGWFDFVVVDAFHRLGRSRRELLTLRNQLAELAVELVSVTEPGGLDSIIRPLRVVK